ncbi:MAG: glycosyltransferase family 1 protein, partial [Chloroflexi bacterium]|nr:glycosyltransferase family 1 protein [Chloroflexota bacterium]
MRIAIDYTSAVQQTEGIGRYTRNLVQTLAALDHENEYVLLHPRGTVAKAQAMAPEQPNFSLRSLPLSERGMTVLWHRLSVPLPADFLVGPITLFHAPDFVLPPRRAP